MKKLLLSCLLIVFIVGCAEPLSQDKLEYAGQWQSPNMKIYIGPDGSFSYKRKEGNKTTSINAPIKEFEGDNFVVGILFMTTKFEVSKPPHKENGVWKMTVDGVELTRVEG